MGSVDTGARGQQPSENAAIFHEATADYGGRLDSFTLDRPVETLDYALMRARGFLKNAAEALPQMPSVHFDLIDNYQFNALAFEYRGRYFIGVNRGTIASLAVLFERMLADPEVLRSIGDPKQEKADLPLLPDIGLDFERSFENVPEFDGPQDPMRIATARRLWELALDFLTAHEFAHLANGHVDYLGRYQGISAIDELGKPPWTPQIPESRLTSQAMEMDADAFAVHVSLASEWGRVTGIYPRRGPEWEWIYDRPGVVSLQWSWAVSTLFRLMGDARLSNAGAVQGSHPPSRLRAVMVQKATGQVERPEGLQTHSALAGDDFQKIPAAIKAASLDIESIFSRLTGRPESPESLDEAWGDIGERHIRTLQKHWQTKLRRELLDFAYQPLFAYRKTGRVS